MHDISNVVSWRMHCIDDCCRCSFCQRATLWWCVLKMIPSLHGIQRRCSRCTIFMFPPPVKSRQDSKHLLYPSMCCKLVYIVISVK